MKPESSRGGFVVVRSGSAAGSTCVKLVMVDGIGLEAPSLGTGIC